MADNVNIPAQGTGDTTPVIAADDVGGVKHQRVKVEWGADGVANDTSAANPLPVVQTGTPGLPTGAATESTLGTASGTLTAQSTLYGAVTETAPASDTASSGLNGRLQRIAQRLTTIIGVLPAALGANGGLKIEGVASGTTVPVSGTVTTSPPSNASTNLAQVAGATVAQGHGTAATALRVELPTDGTGVVNLGTISTAATAAKQPAIGTAGSASVDVISVQGISGGTPLPVTGGGTPTDVSTNATISGTGSTTLSGLNGMSTVVLEILANAATGVTSILEGSIDGTNWDILGCLNGLTSSTLLQTSIGSGAGVYVAPCAGFAQVRFRVSGITSGSFVINLRASAAPTWARQVNVSNTVTTTANLTQVGGATVVAGNGVSSAGLRVTLGNDSTGVVGLNAGTNIVGKVGIDQSTPGTTNLVALAANQSVNAAQIAGTATSVNSGTVDAGTQRVADAGANTGTLSNVAASATSVTVLASNTARRGGSVWNDSTAILYLKFGATASATSATVKLVADAYWEIPSNYTGRIDGIWASATGTARVTETTA